MNRRSLALALMILSPLPAYAQTCPAMRGADEALAESSARQRAAFLRAEARRAHGEAGTWTAIYATSYVGLAAAQMGVLALTDDQGRRTSMAIGAVSSVIGAASLFVLPLRILADIDEVESLYARAHRGDCAALRRMEAVIVAAAGSEDFGQSWLVHVGSVLFNVGVGLLLGLGYGEWISGAISAGSGILVGELQILTQPTPLRDAVERYRAGHLVAPASADLSLRFGLSAGASF